MDVGKVGGSGNVYQPPQDKGEAKKEAEVPRDGMDKGWKPGGITCYMYSKLAGKSDADPKLLAQYKTEAINNALNDGSITVDMAQKLKAEE
ncbi:MAG: hypothetical protein RDV48_19155 [Candidatus Eremiobacteraeota bacterium]|nr:hypothetical protein [Candidatus Eremiobacteraeota bacterium]